MGECYPLSDHLRRPPAEKSICASPKRRLGEMHPPQWRANAMGPQTAMLIIKPDGPTGSRLLIVGDERICFRRTQ